VRREHDREVGVACPVPGRLAAGQVLRGHELSRTRVVCVWFCVIVMILFVVLDLDNY
jgi:hypothetical protein